jgi:CRISPR-associated protein Cas5d
MILTKVRYGIEAHIAVLRPDVARDGTRLAHPEAKHLESFKRRASRGQFFHQPYLGTREFPADFELVDMFPGTPPELAGERKLGWMLHDLMFIDAKSKECAFIESSEGRHVRAEARFFDAVMCDGVIRVPSLDGDEGRSS